MRQQELTRVQIEDIEKETRGFDCPNCGYHMQFRLSVKVNTVQPTLSGEECAARDGRKLPAPKAPIAPATYALAEEAKINGIFDAFVAAMKTSTPHNVPDNLDRYFVTWLSRTHKVRTPQFAIRQCLEAAERDAAGDLEIYAFQNIAAVIKNGVLHSFLPYQFVKGQQIPAPLQSDGNGALQKARQDLTLPVWIKTRNGYVLDKGMLFQELKGKSAGQFANTGI